MALGKKFKDKEILRKEMHVELYAEIIRVQLKAAEKGEDITLREAGRRIAQKLREEEKIQIL